MTNPERQRRETICVVDDDPAVLSWAQDVLRESGYSVIGATDARQALEAARAQPQPVELLLTDIVMPDINGRELADRLRAIWPRLKVLFMSGYSSQFIEDYGVKLSPGEPFLFKPFTPADIESKVRAVLDRRSPFASPRFA